MGRRSFCNLHVWMRLTPPRRRTPARAPAVAIRMAASSALLASLLAAAIPSASLAGSPEREVSLSIAGGYRVYDAPLGLDDDPAILFRLGLGLSSRAQLVMDYLYADPARSVSHSFAHVDQFRLLGRVNALTGATRPYGLFGVGIFVADFADSYDTIAGTVSFGAGIERRFGPQFLLQGEATVEFYRAEVVLYAPDGHPIYRGPRLTEANGTFSAGLGFHF
jgi:hypothetical protein